MVANVYDKFKIKKIDKLADKILFLENEIKSLSDVEIQNKTAEYKLRLNNGEDLDALLIEAFAIVREATFRKLGKKHYKVQLMGGIALHQGRVIDMKTGEGKTLTELCPLYLNALEGKGVHVITVNDYLAKRDKEEMQPVFEFLGLTVGLVTDDTKNKKEEYSKDIVYTTNTEIGFDYLKDNLVEKLENKVQRGLNYVIIDEIDSVLIDEARTPLIIAGDTIESPDLYLQVDKGIKCLHKGDYEKNEKENSIYLTEDGIKKVEKIFRVRNLSDVKNSELNHIINQSLRANFVLEKDKDYIVNNNEIILIDMNTGRIADGRRFSDGLHQCIEAKEGVAIKGNSKVYATITYQNLFSLYNKVGGMSGTVKSEEFEFQEIYNLDVVAIPTNKSIKRIDNIDKFYETKKEKLEAIIEDIIDIHKKGNPILIGTPSIDKSEELSLLLKEKGINHELLNAKTHSKEAEIISKAGLENAITVATNIAGRGTDIKISDEVNKIGGLYVIGSERTMSRRIDNQLIGRAGRQGNNGNSQFYSSCEDELFDVYGNDLLKKKILKLCKKGEIIDKHTIMKLLNKAQESIHNINYEQRKYTLKYDYTINKQRTLIYRDRDIIIGNQDITKNISEILLEEVFSLCKNVYKKYDVVNEVKHIRKVNVHKCFLDNIVEKELFFREIVLSVKKTFNNKIIFSDAEFNYLNDLDSLEEIIDYITNKIINYLNLLLKDEIFLKEDMLRKFLLKSLDSCWIEHLDEMEVLKKIVKDQAYNQKDPIEIYKVEGSFKYKELQNKIRKMFIELIFSNIFEIKIVEEVDLDVIIEK
ncbi:MAG: preprotein translocase subunit SecA [Sarcina sp.]